MQAIETKFLGCTDTKGDRIKATAYSGSITIGWYHELGIEDNHLNAALALCEKFDWQWVDNIVGGQLASGNYCFVKKEQ